ncbi:MAG: choice-of-anchor D domain-containing protein [Clostridiales bacterium]|nr:choice-of-anchor D domain-containing protein [Clostridiales bacterium]
MKKCIKLFSAALIALASFVPAQAMEMTVFNGTATNEYIPVRSYYYDTQNYQSQFILPADQFYALQGAEISAIKFYIATEGGNLMSGGKLSVTIGTTDRTDYSGYSASYVEDVTEVAQITMTPGETEVVVNFTEPWTYQGGNIVIGTKVIETGNAPHVFFYGETSTVQNAAYGSAYITSLGFCPKTTFVYEGGVQDMAMLDAEEIAFGTAYLGNEVTKTITLTNFGQNAFTPVLGTLQAPFTLEANPVELASGESMQIAVTFSANEVGEYTQTLTIDCGAAGQFNVPVTAVAAEAPAEILVCEGNATNSHAPVYGYYYDETFQTQMIYPADELAALAGKKITSVAFHATSNLKYQGGKIQLSFKPVDVDRFDEYVLLDGFTVMATVVPNADDTELVFTLDEPYEYAGGNLAIECKLIEKGSNYPNVSYYGKTMGYNASLTFYGNSNSSTMANFLPMATFGYVKEDTPEPQGIRGDVNNDTFVTIDDVTALINYLLTDVADGLNLQNANCNQDEAITIDDVTKLINFLLTDQW